MKALNQFISEALIHKVRKKTNTTVKPKDKAELKEIIETTIDEEGPECDLNFIDTSDITDMMYLFAMLRFNGDISEWDVSNVKSMAYMFDNSIFNGDISNWDVSNVKDMYAMFKESRFNGDISGWDVSKVNDMRWMFANSNFDGDISGWTVLDDVDYDDMFMGKCPLKKIYGGTPEIKNGRFVKKH